MKRKSNFSKVLTVILSLAVAVGVFYLAFPKQAEDVTNWVTGLFQTEEPPIQEEPSLEEPAPEEPSIEEPTPETPEEPSDETPDEPSEPVVKTANVYIGDNVVGTIEIDSAVLEDTEALETFWLENYDENVRSQIVDNQEYSLRVENASTEDECAIKVGYYRVYTTQENGDSFCAVDVFNINEKLNSEFVVSVCVLSEEEMICSNKVVLNGFNKQLDTKFVFDNFELSAKVLCEDGYSESENMKYIGASVSWLEPESGLDILFTSIEIEIYYNGSITL